MLVNSKSDTLWPPLLREMSKMFNSSLHRAFIVTFLDLEKLLSFKKIRNIIRTQNSNLDYWKPYNKPKVARSDLDENDIFV